MATAVRDLTGQRFHRLQVLEFVGTRLYGGHYKSVFRVRCDCGTVKELGGFHLLSGRTKSCGCLNKELVTERMRIIGSRPKK